MGTYIKRQRYLQKLIDRRDNGEVKITRVLVVAVSHGYSKGYTTII